MISKRPRTDGGAVHPSMMDQQPQPQQHNDGFPPMMMMMMAPYQQNQAPPSPAWNQHYYSASQPLPPTTTTTSSEEEEVRTLCIWGLQHWMDEAYIHQCFFHHHTGGGEVFTSKVIRNQKTGESECYGFIEFKTHAAAERILHKFNGTPMPRLLGSNFCLDWAPSGGGGGRGEKQQLQDDSADLTISVGDDDDLAASSDIVTTDYNNILQQETTTFTSVEEEGPEVFTDELITMGCLIYGAPQFLKEEAKCCKEEAHGSKSTPWEDMLSWSPSLMDGTDKTMNLIWCSLPEEELGKRTALNLFLCQYKIDIDTAVDAPHLYPPIEKSQTVDDAERVREIGALIKMGDGKLAEIGAEYLALLDELIELAESVDIAKELHSIEGLDELLYCMSIPETGLREKTAEVISTMADKYPKSRLLVLEVGLNFLMDEYITDSNATSMAKTLHAIFSLFRNNKEGIALFQVSTRFEVLSHGMTTKCVDFQRCTLNLIHCLLHENNSVCKMVTELGFHRNMMLLACSDDADVREAALRCLLVLTRVEEGGNSEQLVKNDDDLKHFLQKLIEGISAMTSEDLGAAREEIRLVDSLWNACYNKPSSLREKGLFMLPDEDLAMSDLAIKLFEPHH